MASTRHLFFLTKASGEKVPTPAYQSLTDFMDAYNPFAPAGSAAAVHFCFVREGSAEAQAGMGVGGSLLSE